jgi:hypothetical protein
MGRYPGLKVLNLRQKPALSLFSGNNLTRLDGRVYFNTFTGFTSSLIKILAASLFSDDLGSRKRQTMKCNPAALVSDRFQETASGTQHPPGSEIPSP